MALSLASSSAMAAQVTGAIFTTLKDGSAVNYNIYDVKEDVYLNGGPVSPKATCNAARLPDGDYYFQVTDPSGRLLLHAEDDDIAKRKVRVLGGYIVKYYGGNLTREQLTETLITRQVMKCNKQTLTVRLYPFFDTPNPGGEYKVWMSMDPRFIPSQTKTDNFKVAADTADNDGDGLPDRAEFLFGTDPNNPDTDRDGISDGDEVNVYHTDPFKFDTDGDGFSDGDEVNVYHTDPLDENSHPEFG